MTPHAVAEDGTAHTNFFVEDPPQRAHRPLLPMLLAEINRLVFAPPLLIGVSLVYAATRHEDLKSIIAHATSFAVWSALFMVAVGVVLELLAYFQ